jgi:Domain of unknown function (DUF1883)
MYIQFIKCAFGYQHAGSVVFLDLTGATANVFLVDDLNLSRLQRGDQYTYYDGRHTTGSPARVRLVVPSTGSWNAVVIPVNGSVRVSDPRVLSAA